MVRILAIATCALALTAALAAGSSARSLSSQGCNSLEGFFFSNHYYESGDNIVAGYEVTTPKLSEPVERIIVRNVASDNLGTSMTSCGGQPIGTWKLFTSDLGAGDDTLRMDADGLAAGDPAPEGLPASIKAKVTAGSGDDKVRGHIGKDVIEGDAGADAITLYKGRDKAFGGAGADLIRAANGDRDEVDCGPGDDRAIVDPRDDVSNCETVRKKS